MKGVMESLLGARERAVGPSSGKGRNAPSALVFRLLLCAVKRPAWGPRQGRLGSGLVGGSQSVRGRKKEDSNNVMPQRAIKRGRQRGGTGLSRGGGAVES